MAESLPSKPVQEMFINGDELPERYIHMGKGGDGIIDASLPVIEIPAIDLGRLTSLAGEEELQKLRSALNSCGCFQVGRTPDVHFKTDRTPGVRLML